MEETLRKLDELALELKLLTTEMRETGVVWKQDVVDRVDEIKRLTLTL